MSSVIIGIAAVILFIGLALAGATYLGSGITDAKVQANSAIIAQSAQQYAAAIPVYRMRTRQHLPNRLDNASLLLSARILKNVPANPIVPSNRPFTVDETGNLSNERPAFVLMYLGQGTVARDTCIEIERAAGHTDRLTPEAMEVATAFLSHASPRQAGCHRNNAGIGGNGGQPGDYLAYFPA